LACERPVINLKLRTISPISIGSDKGDVLSPYADFVFSDDGKMLHYLNLEKIEEAVGKQKKLEEYIQGIRGGMDNNRSNFNLFRFLTNTLDLDLDEITRRRVPQHGLRPGDRRNINPTVKNAGSPYLPGSSVKGALRTAMLYDWLVNTKAGEKELAENVAILNKIANTDPNKRREIDKFKEDVFNEVPLLGSLKSPFGPDARFLRVSDSKPLSFDKLTIYALSRIRLVQGLGKSVIPQVLEAIPPNQDLYCSISIDPWIRDMAKNEVLDYLADGDFNQIFQIISSFSRDCVINELFELSNANSRDFEKEIDALMLFYENLQNRINDGAVFLRLGFGKTVNDNSLTLALANGMEDQTSFNRFREYFHKLKRETDLFPITRTVTPEGLPMGWVEVIQN